MILNYYFRKNYLFMISGLIFLFPGIILAQKVYFPFHTGQCATEAEAFYTRGFKVKTCPEADAWGKDAESLMQGNCATVYAHAKVEGYGDKPAIGVVGERVIEIAKNCGGGFSANSTSSNSSSQQSKNNTQQSNNAINQVLSSQIFDAMAQREINRQKMVTDDKGPNKYSFIEEIDQTNIESDILILNSGKELKVIILEMTDSQITYKKATLPEGPSFVLKTGNFKKIILRALKD
jgi:hypothetical protein